MLCPGLARRSSRVGVSALDHVAAALARVGRREAARLKIRHHVRERDLGLGAASRRTSPPAVRPGQLMNSVAARLPRGGQRVEDTQGVRSARVAGLRGEPGSGQSLHITVGSRARIVARHLRPAPPSSRACGRFAGACPRAAPLFGTPDSDSGLATRLAEAAHPWLRGIAATSAAPGRNSRMTSISIRA